MSGLVSHPVSGLKGAVRIPGDKSLSHRALMISSLAAGESIINGLQESEDVLRTARALISMGIIITPPDIKNGAWRVRGLDGTPLRQPRGTVFLGNSGTAARLLMGVVSAYPVNAVFTGDESLSRRPMGRVIKPLAQMGARFEASAGDKLPLRVIGATTLRAIDYAIPVASAQVKSAVLLAGLHAKGKTVVHENIVTRDHTERMLKFFGADIAEETANDGGKIITVTGGTALEPKQVIIPADPSAAAFAVVAALVTKDSDIMIPNVCVNDTRAGFFVTLKEMGADISFENPREKSGEPVADIRVRSSALSGVTVPAARVPSMIDEFPVLAVAAAFAKGDTVMQDVGELRLKESDRIAALAHGLKLAGVTLEEGQDSLVVRGAGAPPAGGVTLDSRGDHRIAMSFLVLGMGAKKPVGITNAACITNSFPEFQQAMNGLGARISASDPDV